MFRLPTVEYQRVRSKQVQAASRRPACACWAWLATAGGCKCARTWPRCEPGDSTQDSRFFTRKSNVAGHDEPEAARTPEACAASRHSPFNCALRGYRNFATHATQGHLTPMVRGLRCTLGISTNGYANEAVACCRTPCCLRMPCHRSGRPNPRLAGRAAHRIGQQHSPVATRCHAQTAHRAPERRATSRVNTAMRRAAAHPSATARNAGHCQDPAQLAPISSPDSPAPSAPERRSLECGCNSHFPERIAHVGTGSAARNATLAIEASAYFVQLDRRVHLGCTALLHGTRTHDTFALAHPRHE